MGLRNKGQDMEPQKPTSLVASAATFTVANQAWRSFKFGDVAWQSEIWRFFDLIGEYHFLASWVGRACGRTRLLIANVDDQQNIQDEVKGDKTVSGILNGLFGNPIAKQEALRALGTNLTVAGEVWVVGRGNPAPDQDAWTVVSGVELRRWGGNIVLSSPEGVGAKGEKLIEGTDLLIRVWNPHPRKMLWADSPSRAAVPLLAELEKYQRYTFAQLDSRLAGAGVWLLPQGLSFSQEDGQAAGIPDLMQELVETASAGIRGEGTAASLVPILLEVPPDTLANIKPPVSFASELSAVLDDKKQLALQRLGWAMDTPPEVLKGHADTNHWGSFNIDESTIKNVIEPLMNLICDALHKAYVSPALKLAGKDPAKFALTFSTAGLTVRPQRLQDTLNLYKERIASKASVLEAGDYSETDGMTEEELIQLWIRDVVIANPAYFASYEVRKAAGVPDSMLGKDVDLSAVLESSQTPPANEATQVAPHAELPVTPDVNKSKAIGGPRGPQKALAASGDPDTNWKTVALTVAANATVRRALELGGGRLLTPALRGTLKDVPRHEIYTRVQARDRDQCVQITSGAWTHLSSLTADLGVPMPASMEPALASYCYDLLLTGDDHQADKMMERLYAAGVL